MPKLVMKWRCPLKKSKMESNKTQTKVMKPSEPQTRRVVVFCIWKKSRTKVKKSKSSLLRGINHAMTRQKAEKQNEGNLEGRGTVERF